MKIITDKTKVARVISSEGFNNLSLNGMTVDRASELIYVTGKFGDFE